MSNDPDWAEVIFVVVCGIMVCGWLILRSFLNSHGITLSQFGELIGIEGISAGVVAIIIAAECSRLGIVEKWTRWNAGSIGSIGIISGFAGGYIWLNFDVTMVLGAVLGAAATLVTVHVVAFAILLLISWWNDRKNSRSQNQPTSSPSHRREKENESSSENGRVRTRPGIEEYRDPARKDDSRYQNQTTERDSRYQ